MRNILDIGSRGAEFMDVAAPTPSVDLVGVQQFSAIVDKFPTSKIECEVNDGTKREVEVHALLMSNPQVFKLIWEMSIYEPMVYARSGKRLVMGILSPNFDNHGENRLPQIKVLPLITPYPLVARGTDLLPDARMATMLAGSAHSEGKGSGGHDKPPEQDYEHKFTFLGAISLGKNTITTEKGKHVQHAVRQQASVATGLTNGSLGNIFVPGGDRTGDFTGYGMPVVFDAGKTEPGDALYIPKGFLHNEEAYGVHYPDASRITYGAGIKIMYDRIGQGAVSEQIRQIAQTS